MLSLSLLQADKARKDAQSESQENADRLKDLQDQFNSLSLEKRRIEGDLMSLQSEVKDLEDEVRAAEEKASKAESEVCFSFLVRIVIFLSNLHMRINLFS